MPESSTKGTLLRFILTVLVLFGVLAGCSENGTENQSGARPTLVAIATSTAIPSQMESTSLPTPAPTPTHTPAEAPSPTLAPSVANTPTLPPTPTASTTETLQPVETASPTRPPQPLPGTWRGLVVAPEERCSPYDFDDYLYNQSVERRIVEELNGLVYGPYTGTHFENTRQTDIEHIVARSEATIAACAPRMLRPRNGLPPTSSTLPWPARRSTVNRRSQRTQRNGFRISTNAGSQTE